MEQSTDGAMVEGGDVSVSEDWSELGRELAARDVAAYREAKAILCELVKRVRRRSDQPTGILGFGVPRGDA